MGTIVDQFGRPFSKKTPPRETFDLSYAPMTQSDRAQVAAGLTPERLAAIFIEADGGDMARQSQLFEQIEERSGHLVGEKSKRVNAILDVPFEFTPASDDARDVDICEEMEAWWDGLTDASDVLTSLQDAVGKGFSAMEINWDVSEGQAKPTGFDFLEQRRFVFRDDTGYVSKIPKLITDDNLMGMDLPPWRVVMHTYGGKSGHPTRSGIYRVVCWNHLFINYSIKDWLIFCEVCGIPARIGKYESGASKEDKAALRTALRSIGTDASGIISKSTEIEFIEKKGAVSGDLYLQLVTFCNKEISKAVLGQTLSADVGDSGSYAAAKTHNDIREDLLRADARALAKTIRAQIFRPWVYFNHGFDAAIPGFDAQWDDDEDLNAKSEWMERVLARVAVPKTWFLEQFKIPEATDGEETVGGPSAGPGLLAEPAKPETAKAAAKKIVAKAAAQSNGEGPEDTLAAIGQNVAEMADTAPWLVRIEAAMDNAADLAGFRSAIMAMAETAGLDHVAMGELLANAMAVADLAGRFDA